MRTILLNKNRKKAFTRLELISLIGVAIVLVTLLFPMLARSTSKTGRIKCINNLKTVGLAYRIFATDNQGRYPMELSVTNGGSLEMTDDIAFQFRVLSNELSTPRLLICPNRKTPRPTALDFNTLHRTNIDYFLGLTSRETLPYSILSGDAGFHNNGKIADDGVFKIKADDQVRYLQNIHLDGRHQGLLKGDGSVDLIGTESWQQQLAKSEVPTNIFLVP